MSKWTLSFNKFWKDTDNKQHECWRNEKGNALRIWWYKSGRLEKIYREFGGFTVSKHFLPSGDIYIKINDHRKMQNKKMLVGKWKGMKPPRGKQMLHELD